MYIKREDAIKHKRMMQGFGFSQQDEYLAAAVLVEDIEKISAADVEEVVHGQWVDEDGEIVCSECRIRIPELYSNADSIMPHECKFCHACGAKMDKESL